MVPYQGENCFTISYLLAHYTCPTCCKCWRGLDITGLRKMKWQYYTGGKVHVRMVALNLKIQSQSLLFLPGNMFLGHQDSLHPAIMSGLSRWPALSHKFIRGEHSTLFGDSLIAAFTATTHLCLLGGRMTQLQSFLKRQTSTCPLLEK